MIRSGSRSQNVTAGSVREGTLSVDSPEAPADELAEGGVENVERVEDVGGRARSSRTRCRGECWSRVL